MYELYITIINLIGLILTLLGITTLSIKFGKIKKITLTGESTSWGSWFEFKLRKGNIGVPLVIVGILLQIFAQILLFVKLIVTL